MKHALTEFFTATPRAGCEPSFTIDLLGHRKGDFGLFTDTPTTLSYARVHMGESSRSHDDGELKLTRFGIVDTPRSNYLVA